MTLDEFVECLPYLFALLMLIAVAIHYIVEQEKNPLEIYNYREMYRLVSDKIKELDDFYILHHACRNCGERNQLYIKKGHLAKYLTVKCDKCHCTITL
jgi:hypothetical protein